jgi:hypothetical protein
MPVREYYFEAGRMIFGCLDYFTSENVLTYTALSKTTRLLPAISLSTGAYKD